MSIIEVADVAVIERGSGIRTTPLVTGASVEGGRIVTGISSFRHTGEDPMVILWISTSDRVTRTFSETGETVEHLSAADLRGDAEPGRRGTD